MLRNRRGAEDRGEGGPQFVRNRPDQRLPELVRLRSHARLPDGAGDAETLKRRGCVGQQMVEAPVMLIDVAGRVVADVDRDHAELRRLR